MEYYARFDEESYVRTIPRNDLQSLGSKACIADCRVQAAASIDNLGVERHCAIK